VYRDITERKERERQLSTLMDNIPGMVYRCRNEPGWPMEFVSEGCQELTGYDPEALESDDLSYGRTSSSRKIAKRSGRASSEASRMRARFW